VLTVEDDQEAAEGLAQCSDFVVSKSSSMYSPWIIGISKPCEGHEADAFAFAPKRESFISAGFHTCGLIVIFEPAHWAIS
jgi:hypothetical protein